MVKKSKKPSKKPVEPTETLPVKKDDKSHLFSATNQPENPGRKLAVIDEVRLEELAACDYTMEELAAEFDVHLDTIRARFSASLKKGRLRGNGSLKRRIFAKAMEGDIGALVWLTKNRFGYRDKQPDEATHIQFNVMVQEVPK